MANSDVDGEPSMSEVGSQGQQQKDKLLSDENSAMNLLSNMEALLTRVLAANPSQTRGTFAQSNVLQLVTFNPDDPDADIEGWCKVTELIVMNKDLEGIDLLVALTSTLKGRAASCFTKLNLDVLTWAAVKDFASQGYAVK